MISIDDHHIYFGGDTAYSDHFSSIAKEFNNISCALLPIGPCEPRKWMRHAHMSAEEAGQAFLDLQAETLVPMHWGTFRFGVDQFETPHDRLCTWWQNQSSCTTKQLMSLKIGERKPLEKQLIQKPDDTLSRKNL